MPCLGQGGAGDGGLVKLFAVAGIEVGEGHADAGGDLVGGSGFVLEVPTNKVGAGFDVVVTSGHGGEGEADLTAAAGDLGDGEAAGLIERVRTGFVLSGVEHAIAIVVAGGREEDHRGRGR